MSAQQVAPEDYAPLKRAADAGRVSCWISESRYDADSFWFNLKPGAFAGDPRASWLQRDELRRAISLAVDRQTVRRHGVPRRGRAGVRSDHAGQQEMVLAETAAHAARSGGARGRCWLRSA